VDSDCQQQDDALRCAEQFFHEEAHARSADDVDGRRATCVWSRAVYVIYAALEVFLAAAFLAGAFFTAFFAAFFAAVFLAGAASAESVTSLVVPALSVSA